MYRLSRSAQNVPQVLRYLLLDEVIHWLIFYDHRRLHSTLGYVSPMRLEGNWNAGQPKKAA
jgi:hypothetical protein